MESIRVGGSGWDFESRFDNVRIRGAGGFLLPGDVNGDARINIADPVTFLNFLFASSSLADCFMDEDMGSLSPEGRAVIDWNGDGAINIADPVGSLNSLFGGGDNHVLGTSCQVISGKCITVCVPQENPP